MDPYVLKFIVYVLQADLAKSLKTCEIHLLIIGIRFDLGILEGIREPFIPKMDPVTFA